MKARVSKRFEKFMNERPSDARKLLRKIIKNPDKVMKHEWIEYLDIKVKQL